MKKWSELEEGRSDAIGARWRLHQLCLHRVELRLREFVDDRARILAHASRIVRHGGGDLGFAATHWICPIKWGPSKRAFGYELVRFLVRYGNERKGVGFWKFPNLASP